MISLVMHRPLFHKLVALYYDNQIVAICLAYFMRIYRHVQYKSVQIFQADFVLYFALHSAGHGTEALRHMNPPNVADALRHMNPLNVTEALRHMNPPNVGITGPTGGRRDIFTFEFVHRTHIDIFGFYYPPEFPGAYHSPTRPWALSVLSTLVTVHM